MAFSNPVTQVGSATSGLTVTSGTFTAPTAGQLVYVNLRVPTLTTPSVAPTVLLLNASSVTVTTMTPCRAPVTVGNSTTFYEVTYSAIAVGTETSATCTWVGTAASAAPGQAIIEYDEFDGFLGTPTLDVVGASASFSNGTSLSAGAGAPISTTPELAIAGVVLSSSSGAWKTGSTNSFFEAVGASTVALTLTGSASSPENVGWVDYAGAVGTNAEWQMAWTTSRASAVTGVSFYDLVVTAATFPGVFTRRPPRLQARRQARSGEPPWPQRNPPIIPTVTRQFRPRSLPWRPRKAEPPWPQRNPPLPPSIGRSWRPWGRPRRGLTAQPPWPQRNPPMVPDARRRPRPGIGPRRTFHVEPPIAQVTPPPTKVPDSYRHPRLGAFVRSRLPVGPPLSQVVPVPPAFVPRSIRQAGKMLRQPKGRTGDVAWFFVPPPVPTTGYPPWIVVDGQLAWHVAGIWYMRI